MSELKDAEEYHNEYSRKCYGGYCNKELYSVNELVSLIKQAQLDAWNAAVKECAENAEYLVFAANNFQESIKLLENCIAFIPFSNEGCWQIDRINEFLRKINK